MPDSADTYKDFFISYNGADQEWAEWIAWQLEHAGFSVIVQAWDFRPGANFVVEMDHASRVAGRTVVVLTPNFLGSSFTPAEWASAFAKDPTGTKRLIVPVRVAECDVTGLLGQVVYIDLVGLSRSEASKKLLAGIQPGRSKPTVEPVFPGGTKPSGAMGAQPAQVGGLQWQNQPNLEVTWRNELSRNFRENSGHTIVEVQLVPTEPLLLQVRRISDLPDELAAAGRQGGLFNASQQLTTDSTSDFAFVAASGNFAGEDAGLLVTRAGQRGAWISLPHDSMGSVLDEAELSARLSSVLGLLMSLDLPVAPRYGLAISLGPTMMLTVGSSSVVGNRTSASMMSIPDGHILLPVEDSVGGDAIGANTQELASELVARLLAKTKRRN